MMRDGDVRSGAKLVVEHLQELEVPSLQAEATLTNRSEFLGADVAQPRLPPPLLSVQGSA
jgi:hypothetical protein